jgi:hypothetical protein
MEIICGNYDVKLIPNPMDFILRLENRENARLFERTFFERDFAEYIVLGGLEFIINLLKDVMPKQAGIKESPTQATFTVSWTPQFTRRIDFNFVVPAIKRDKASGDIEEVTARMKKMEKIAAEQKAALDRMLVLYDKISANVTELEARCRDTITLPGCDYAISTDVINLILVKNWGMLSDGRQFSTFYQDFYFQSHPSWSEYNPNTPFNHAQHGQNPPWSIVKNGEKAIIFNNLKSIKNLKYCKNLYSLTICGAQELKDYNLSDLKNLNTLNIIANFGHQPPTTYKVKDSHPSITDISWISNLKSLEKVSFRGCNQLVNIGPIKDLPNLKELDLQETGVKNTGFLASSTLKIIV